MSGRLAAVGLFLPPRWYRGRSKDRLHGGLAKESTTNSDGSITRCILSIIGSLLAWGQPRAGAERMRECRYEWLIDVRAVAASPAEHGCVNVFGPTYSLLDSWPIGLRLPVRSASKQAIITEWILNSTS